MTLNTTQLCRVLGIRLEEARSFRRMGMPCRKKGRLYVYDPIEIARWLRNKGLVGDEVDDDQVVCTAMECAKHMGVQVRAVRDWHHHPEFPGIPNKHYPLRAIERWHAEHIAPNNSQAKWGRPATSASRERKEAAVADLKELQLQKERGELVRLDDVLRMFEAIQNAALAQWEPAVAQCEQRFPSSADPSFKQQILEIVSAACQQAINAQCDLFRVKTLVEDGDSD